MGLKKLYSLLFAILVPVLSLFSQSDEVRCINPRFDNTVDRYLSGSVPVISVADAYPSREEFVFLDAREEEEYEVSHIKDAIHIGYDNFDMESVRHLDKETPIIIYCSIGYRSEKVGEKLREEGYTTVLNLYGSIFEWVNQYHPVYTPNGVVTNKIHTFNKKWAKWVQAADVEKVQ